MCAAQCPESRSVSSANQLGIRNHVVIAYPERRNLLKDRRAIANVKKAVEPVAKDGYDSRKFESRGEVAVAIDKETAAFIADFDPETFEDTEVDAPQGITAWVTVYSPVYDPAPPKWRFLFGSVPGK